MTELCTVKLTPNFERNLDEVEVYLRESEAPHAIDAVLDELISFVVPNLERFPRMGRSLIARTPRSVEATQAAARLEKALAVLAAAAEIREYLTKHYLVLYALADGTVLLLAIRHHQQLSFDLMRHWQE